MKFNCLPLLFVSLFLFGCTTVVEVKKSTSKYATNESATAFGKECLALILKNDTDKLIALYPGKAELESYFLNLNFSSNRKKDIKESIRRNHQSTLEKLKVSLTQIEQIVKENGITKENITNIDVDGQIESMVKANRYALDYLFITFHYKGERYTVSLNDCEFMNNEWRIMYEIVLRVEKLQPITKRPSPSRD